MTRVTSRSRARERAKHPDRGGVAGAIGLLAPPAAFVLALYLAHPLLAGHQFPIGPDGPVYTWLARLAGATGFLDAPGGGPGVPAVTLFFDSLLGTDPVQSVMVLGPLLAATCGLTAAGLLEAALGPNAARSVAAVVLTGAFTAYLAGGWLANVSMASVFLAALAALALVQRSWRAAWLAAGLLMAAGMAHRVFLLLGLAILGGVIAAHVPTALSDRRGGRRWSETAAIRMTVATMAGGAGTLLGGILLSLERTIPGDTSQDGFFRRVGLDTLLRDRYRERFLGDAARASIPVAVGLGLGAAGVEPGQARAESGRRFLLALAGSWGALTVAGAVVLAVTGWGPPNRLLQFAFFLPLAAAAGLAVVMRRSAGGRRRTAMAAAVAAGLLFTAVSMFGWFRQAPAFTDDELAAARRAGRVVAGLPDGTPLVFAVDTSEPAAAYHVTRMANVLRMGVPATRIPEVRVVVGAPADAAAGLVTPTGDAERDAIAGTYAREARAILDAAVVLVVRQFNERGWQEAITEGREVTPDVAVVSGPLPPEPGPLPTEEASGWGPWGLIGVSLASIVILTVLGWGWSRWGLVGADPSAALAVAPSVGIGVAVLASFLADRLGARPGGLIATAIVLVLGALGYLAAAWTGRHSRPRRQPA